MIVYEEEIEDNTEWPLESFTYFSDMIKTHGGGGDYIIFRTDSIYEGYSISVGTTLTVEVHKNDHEA